MPMISWSDCKGKASRSSESRTARRGKAEVTAGEPGADEEVRQRQCGYYSLRFTAEVACKRNFSPLSPAEVLIEVTSQLGLLGEKPCVCVEEGSEYGGVR